MCACCKRTYTPSSSSTPATDWATLQGSKGLRRPASWSSWKSVSYTHLVQKRCRGDLADPRELKRVSDSLLRRGFSWAQVKAALSRYAELPPEED